MQSNTDASERDAPAEVTTTLKRTPRGGGELWVRGPERESVQQVAIALYGDLDRQWRQPSYPITAQRADGVWVAHLTFWSVE